MAETYALEVTPDEFETIRRALDREARNTRFPQPAPAARLRDRLVRQRIEQDRKETE